jgi:hypothetical protein
MQAFNRFYFCSCGFIVILAKQIVSPKLPVILPNDAFPKSTEKRS